jgi:hypothetical protein
MQLDLNDKQTRALLNLLVEVIEADPFSPRVRVLREILAKFGPMGPARPPPPEERNPRRRPKRQGDPLAQYLWPTTPRRK